MFGIAPSRTVVDTSKDPYRIRIEVAGATIETYVKGVLVDVTVDDTFTQGCVGFREGGGGEQGGFADLRRRHAVEATRRLTGAGTPQVGARGHGPAAGVGCHVGDENANEKSYVPEAVAQASSRTSTTPLVRATA